MEGCRKIGEVPSQKKFWKAFSDNLVTLTFKSLDLVSIAVAVALRGVTRIKIVTLREFWKTGISGVCFRVL